MAGQRAEDFTTTQTNAQNKGIGFKGKEAGRDAKYREAEERRWRDEYDASKGFGGIAGAGKKSRELSDAAKRKAYEEGWEAFRAKKRQPKPGAGLSSEEAADALEKRKP